MNLRSRSQEVAKQIDALSLRERAMLMLGAFMVLFLIWDWLLMSDIAVRSKAVNAEIETVRDGIGKLNQAIAAAAQTRGADPNAGLQKQLDAAEQRIEELDKDLARRVGQVIPPGEMAGVLEELLQRQGRLELVRVQSLPPEALFRTTAVADASAELPASIYRHGLELEIEGRYLDVLAYLRELEALDWQFFWEAVELQSEEYPSNRVRIRIYSLNLEEGWLGV